MPPRLRPFILAVVLAGLVLPAPADAGTPRAPAGPVWRAAAASGAPVTLSVGSRTLLVDVAENRTLFEGPVLEASGAPYAGPAVLPLEGAVVGEPGSWARVTVYGDRVIGMLHSTSIGQVTLAPLRDGTTGVFGAAAVSDLIRRSGVDTTIEPGEVEAAEDCDSLLWQPQVASPLFLVEGAPERTLDVAWAVDGSFRTLYGDDWAGAATGIINAVDGMYDAQFDLRLSIVHLVVVDDADLDATTTDVMLALLQDYYVANHPTLERDNVNLFTSREMTNAAGQVNCVGSAGRTTVSYSVVTTEGGPFVFGPLILLPDKAVKVAAHELAHTVSAHHHYANCVETAPRFDPIYTLDVCTVMINDWGLIQTTFSSLERLTVRGWIDYYDL